MDNRRTCRYCGHSFSSSNQRRCKKCRTAATIEKNGHTGSLMGGLLKTCRRRGWETDLTKANLVELRQTGCLYCGGPLPIHQPGLDRIDNHLGYMLGNVVPCCWYCNRERGTLSWNEWWLILNDRQH